MELYLPRCPKCALNPCSKDKDTFVTLYISSQRFVVITKFTTQYSCSSIITKHKIGTHPFTLLLCSYIYWKHKLKNARQSLKDNSWCVCVYF